MAREQLIGTWSLVACEARSADGEIAYPYGKRPHGQLIYDATGHMSGQLSRVDRPTLASSARLESSPDETKRAFDSFDAYFRTFELIEAEGVVMHHVNGSLFPNWTGTDQTRFFAFADEQLLLSTPPIADRGTTFTVQLDWERP